MAEAGVERLSLGSGALGPGYEIARVINGGWQLSQGHRLIGSVDPDEAVRGMVAMARAGFTTFDCADIYTGVEELFGRFLRRWRDEGGRREDIQIHTKFVPDMSRLAEVDRRYVRRIVDRSLARLGAERLDLVQFHWWDYGVPGLVEAAGWLDELRRAGKIRQVGLTNFDVPHARAIVQAGIPVASNQVQYSLLDRRPEHGMAAFCLQHGIRLLCYGALAGGFLTGRYLGGPDPRERPETRSLVKYRLILDEFGGWDALQLLLGELRRIAERHGVSMANVAVRFVLQQSGVGAAIVGAPNARHLQDNLGVFRFFLDEQDLAALRRVVDGAPDPAGDCFALERVAGGPHAAIMKTNLNTAGGPSRRD